MRALSRLSATARIAFSLVSVTLSLLLLASLLGFFPDRRSAVVDGRMRLCESLAINFSTMASHADVGTMQKSFQAVADRHPEILSMGVRRASGTLLLEMNEHQHLWTLNAESKSTDSELIVPVFGGQDQLWGTVEVKFTPINASGLMGVLAQPELKLAMFMSLAGLISYYVLLRKVLRQLNPSRVIPGRVREALDSLAEGLLVLDKSERVVLANHAFEQATGRSTEDLMGRAVSELPFVSRGEGSDVLPWSETIQSGDTVKGRLLGLIENGHKEKTFSVSAAPIVDEQGEKRGALASFEDVTQLETKKTELKAMVDHLHSSFEKIKRQNEDLEILATRDPLTGCLNRRSLFERLEEEWSLAERQGYSISVLMVDVDHFKSVNDTHGHTVGDEVLRAVAEALKRAARATDMVCRYGGEEFAIVLLHTDLDGAALSGERLRVAVEQLRVRDIEVTVSLGITSSSEHADDPQQLLDQADRCLYAAKRNGRNQAVRFDQITDEREPQLDLPKEGKTQQMADGRKSVSIPFHSVTALISALAYRDQDTAAHSRRVADLCVATAEGLLSLGDCYTLEVAGLLHDIGKVGIPDSILLKPGRLTAEEWKIMKDHDRIGVEIIRAAFASDELTAIVEHHRHSFMGDSANPQAPRGPKLPIGARILAIADAYDAMISDRVYLKGRSRDEAFAELRRCAGTQFDAELVERFITVNTVRPRKNVSLVSELKKQTALDVGQQMERLSVALDTGNLDLLESLVRRLKWTATKRGVTEIVDKSMELELILETDRDLIAVMQTATELLDLCRSTQTMLLTPG